MIVDLVTFRDWVSKSKIRQEGCVLRIVNPAFFLKQFTGTGPEDGDKFRQLKETLENELPKSKWMLTFVVKYDEDADPLPKWSVSVKGKVLEVLQSILYNDNKEKNLKLVAKEFGMFREKIGLKIERVATEMKPVDTLDKDVSKHVYYIQNDIEVPHLEDALRRDIEWGLSLQLVIDQE